MAKRKLSASVEHSVHTYAYLHTAAEWALEQAEGNEEGGLRRLFNCMSSIILSAFCIEAYLNHIGSKFLPYWDDEVKKGLSINNKFKIICHHFNLSPDYSRRPFHSLREIIKYRNLMAHAITEKISLQVAQVARLKRANYPQTWWGEHTNLKTAKRWLKDTESMITEINKAAGERDYLTFIFGTLSVTSSKGE